jgi:release factor glutamine methyltransferase
MTAPITDLLESITARLSMASETPQLDAQVLLAHVVGQPRTWLLAHASSPTDPRRIESLEAMVRRLERGEPLAYVVGHREFCGLDFDLTHDVLIPRPETELLVEEAIAWLKAHPNRRRIVDVGTGCGCIAASIAHTIPEAQVLATDISLAALRVGADNARKLGIADQIDFLNCDILPRRKPNQANHLFDVVCANLPYIPTSKLQRLRALSQEPALALDGGPDGLDPIRSLLGVVMDWLAPGGLVLLEIESSQGAGALSLAYDTFHEATIRLRQDLAGHDRLLTIQLRGA